VLLFASAGVFHHSGIKIPFFAFFAHDSGLRPKEAPWNMLIAMGAAAALCIGIGVFPGPLYAILPYEVDYHSYTVEHVVTQLQLLIFSALAFTVLMRTGIYPPELRSTNLDSDWLWRMPGWQALGGLASGARVAWKALEGGVKGGTGRLARTLSEQHGPTGALARTRPSGSMAFWMTVMLLAFLVFSFL
jgi:multicomponent Na+:H+ antiporter subunit D